MTKAQFNKLMDLSLRQHSEIERLRRLLADADAAMLGKRSADYIDELRIEIRNALGPQSLSTTEGK